MSTTAPASTAARATFPSPRWWVSDRSGTVVVAQWPTPALVVWIFSVLVARSGLLDGGREATLTRIGQGALVAWSLDELVRGASPVRRVLGAVVVVVLLVRLFG